MDLMSTAQLLGNFGEFVGAIAVVVTLGYLAIQIQQNTRAIRYTARQTQTSEYAAFMDLVMLNPDLGKAHEIIETGPRRLPRIEGLSESESLTAARLLYRALSILSSQYDSWSQGLISDEAWKEAEAVLTGYLQSNATRALWRGAIHSMFSSGFVQMVNRQIETTPTE